MGGAGHLYPLLPVLAAARERGADVLVVGAPSEPARSAAPLADWWAGSVLPLVYLTFGSVFGSLSVAAAVYRSVVSALAGL